MIFRGRPLPPELIPPTPQEYEQFLTELISPARIQKISTFLQRIHSDWSVLNTDSKIRYFNACYEKIFLNFVPQPKCSVTFARIRFSASFHYDDWSIRFSENFIQEPFLKIFKVWLHEMFHALLHFVSIRVDFANASSVIKAPHNVMQIARSYPITDQNHISFMFGGKNLIGMTDRYMIESEKRKGGWSVGWDSYYLNVEIMTETLTELTYKKLLRFPYQRSYTTAEQYINARLDNIPPIKAAGG